MLDNKIVTYDETKTAPIREIQVILASLVAAENEWYRAITAQYSNPDPRLSHRQWEDIVARLYTLLCEYCDFFSTTQDNSASPRLRELARVDLEDSDVVIINITTLDADELGYMEQESPVAITVPLHDEAVTAAMDINTTFVRAHGLLFSGKDYDQFIAQSKILTEHLAISACYESNPIMRIIKQGRVDEGGLAMSHTLKADKIMPDPNQRFAHALDFISRAHRAVFSSTGKEKTYSYLHVALVFLHHMSKFPNAMALVGAKMPWKGICSFLNIIIESCSSVQKIESDDLLHSVSRDTQPLPEDFALRGLLWAKKYYPDEWFSRIGADTDETGPLTGWMLQERADRYLWLGYRITKSGVWLQYDETVGRFRADSRFDAEL
ncbi:hypothetical protein CCUS01_11214 [Colletotrichum cuscutae]|uniref:Uncharacterized protein n=1 Tax=Colletotrichum cuscutae TaxID=1209917 RepID=A0AAI9U5Z1_9PEZI|nr:hypothetical protein CCUS01_11214 [Colletotrichum cuscutae]